MIRHSGGCAVSDFGVKNMKQKKFLSDLAVVTLSTAMIGAATCCYVRAALGSDSVALFVEGLSRKAGFSLGTASWVLNIFLLTTAFLVNRKDLGWTTIYNSLLCGLFIDLANWALDPILGLSNGLVFRWGLLLSGIALVAGGCALMMRNCPGMSVNDALSAGLARRLGCSFRVVRIGVDAVLMIAGVVMGGVIGVGTVLAVLGTGPLIQWFYQLGKKT